MDVKITGDLDRIPSCFTDGYHKIMVTMSRSDG